MLSCCLQQREKLENLEITLKSGFSKFLKVHASVLQWASEQFLEKKKRVGKNNVNNATQNGVNFRDFVYLYIIHGG